MDDLESMAYLPGQTHYQGAAEYFPKSKLQESEARVSKQMVLVKLVERFQTGDRVAFRELYAAEGLRLSRYIRRYTKTLELTEDVVQEVWLLAWQHRQELKNPDSFLGWIYQIARNSAIRALKVNNRTIQFSSFDGLEDSQEKVFIGMSSGHDPREEAERDQWKALLESEINKLDPLSQEILVMRFVGKLKLKEIAENLDLPLQTVNTRLRRALGTIRQQMDDQEIDNPLQ